MAYFINRLSEQDQERHKAELAEHHYAMQKEYYQQFHAQQEDTKALWHDISKYMRAMQALTVENNAKEAKDVLSQVQALIDSVDGVVDVNNSIVSVILNEYVVAAKELNMKLKLDVQIPSELFVTAADLYVLIGNTLDNALDACSELDETAREINLHLRLHNDILFYQLSNPYIASHAKRKRNQYHGYGLKNVCKCVERYNGTLTTDDSNGIFCVTARLNSI
jgi:sensor histidine kinase regulating citrate/malate metabolism